MLNTWSNIKERRNSILAADLIHHLLHISDPKTAEHSSLQVHVGMLWFCQLYCFPRKTFDPCLLSYRRELSYFGVKVAIIEPGGFKTGVSDGERLSHNARRLWGQTSLEVKEAYGENFLDSCK